MAKHFLQFATADHRQGFLDTPEGAAAYVSRIEERLLIAELDQDQIAELAADGVTIFDDISFEKADGGTPGPGDQNLPLHASLAQVVQQVRAPMVWNTTRGEGVTVVILDTGIADAPEFAQKHSPLSFSTVSGVNPWDSLDGHGAMCASIAAGTSAAGGRYNGVAPGAAILSARAESYDASEMYQVYETLLQLRTSQALRGPVVLNNSWGAKTCQAPTQPLDHPFFQIVSTAAQAGMASVFAAGDWHADQLCNWSPTDCGPNSIWSANSLDSVMSVGAVDWNGANQLLPHGNSSRGPGQWSPTLSKPDCVAPTYGDVLRWRAYESRTWWGTSAAAPVVAGTLALVLSRALQLGRAMTVPAAFDLVRQTCQALPAGASCVGHGLVDCLASVSAVQ